MRLREVTLFPQNSRRPRSGVQGKDALAVAGLFRLRLRPDWKRLPAVDWLYPLVPGVFIATSLWMLGYTLRLRPKEPLWGIATMAAGGIFYRLVLPRRPTATSESAQ